MQPKSKTTNTKKSNKSFLSRLSDWKEKTKDMRVFQYSFGIIILTLGIFMFIVLINFIISYSSDQSVIEDITMADENGRLLDVEEVSNKGGRVGVLLGQFFVQKCFGISSILIPIFIILLGLRILRFYSRNILFDFINLTFIMFWVSIFLAFTLKPFYDNSSIFWGGIIGLNISKWLIIQIGAIGLILLLISTALIYAATVNYTALISALLYVKNLVVSLVKKMFAKREVSYDEEEELEEKVESLDTIVPKVENQEIDSLDLNDEEFESKVDIVENQTIYSSDKVSFTFTNEPVESVDKPIEVEIVDVKQDEIVDTSNRAPYNPISELKDYSYPTLDLMRQFSNDAPTIDTEEQAANKDKIISTLRSFGIEIVSIKATVGPTVTLYEITPVEGVRISKIRSLEDDIALSLSADGIRIIAPIPGKGTVGIEVPNRNPKIVSGQSVIGSKTFQESDYNLPVVLGKTITNEVFMFDLCSMPHLLVAGATGQGKSVGLNAIITSLLYKKHPAELKFVLVDPKKVEFSIYSIIENHFLAKLPNEDEPIITDVKKVVQTLNSVCIEMDSRYDLLKSANARNVKEYNKKFSKHMLRESDGHRYMPYIVVVIDEFGDLIMTAGKEVELPIARLAQLARAVGIHMIIATQRPTTNIITGTIKANFPARIAFRVSSMTDSRTILDRSGANRLIGKGDMLFLQGAEPVRVQCAFIDTPEVEEITRFISEQPGFPTPHYLPEYIGDDDEVGGLGELTRGEVDPLFADAARLVVANQLGSTSLLQRKMSIGYARAGRLMDQLERAGIVGAGQGSKPREVLCFSEIDLENIISSYM